MDHRSFQLLEEIANTIYNETQQRPISPMDTGTKLQEIEQFFQDSIKEEGVGAAVVLTEFRDHLAKWCMGISHPLYLGLVNSSSMPGAAFADFLVSSVNNNGGAAQQSPAFSGAERYILCHFASICRQPEGTSGILLPGGSYANLHGLQIARTRAAEKLAEASLKKLRSRPLRLYVSDVVHFSNARAAATLGLDADEIIAVPTIGRGAMCPDALREAIRADKEAGCAPIAVVATLGTTGSGALDPLHKIAEVCRDEDVWMHVDACYGGAILCLEEKEPLFRGIEAADSVAIDPHKWFFVPLTSSISLTRHRQLERQTFQVEASYIPDGETLDPWQKGFPTSRRCSGFTTWMALRIHGMATVRQTIRHNIALTRHLELQLEKAGFDVMEGGELSIACARFVPQPAASADIVDALQGSIAEAIAATGDAWFSTTKQQGKTWLRFNIVNLNTREEHLDQFVEQLSEVARKLA